MEVSYVLRQSVLLLAITLLSCQKNRPPKNPDRNHRGIIVSESRGSDSLLPNWFTKHNETDGVEGVGADRVHQNNPSPRPIKEIIVAVIDSGVDIHHEDLKEKIWINKNEIPNNNIDDDGNGFVDDIHGWNFAGGKDAEGKPTHMEHDTLEVTREYAKILKKRDQLSRQGQKLSIDDQKYFIKVQMIVQDGRKEAQDIIESTQSQIEKLKNLYHTLKPSLDVSFDDVTLETLKGKPSHDEMTKLLMDIGVESTGRLLDRMGYARESLDFHYNINFDPRKTIIGDDVDNLDDHEYGNNDVIGPDAAHGTHVAGIIAAKRGNGIGIDGIASNVKIMVLRAVANGDEHDKDIYNSIKYAVDHGAHIINMSFGKTFSPHQTKVAEVFEYALKKNVLIVHAAGNDGANNDLTTFFPSRTLLSPEIQHPGWIEVGASSAKKDENLVANFSNYGQNQVDVFAPGVSLHSTVPGNEYATFSGTSMASPAVAGVAALILSHQPHMPAHELKKQLMVSTRNYSLHQVILPGSELRDLVSFSKLSISAGIIDAWKCFKSFGSMPL